MLSENVFKFSLIASLIIHGVVLYRLPAINMSSLNKSLQEVEVTYYKLQMLKIKTEDVKPVMKKTAIKQNLALVKKENPPSPVSRDMAAFFKKVQSPPRNQTSIKQIHPQKKVSLPEFKSDSKISNPKYNNYYQIVRDKIRKCAYDNYQHYETGEVYLVFVVLGDGSLKDAKIIEEKTRAERYLREIALESIKDASPYPRFPDELAYPELTFNVIISFEISE